MSYTILRSNMVATMFKRSRALLPFLLIAFYFLLLRTCGLIRFEGNDDVLMALISSGAYSGTAEHHLVFINIIYGYSLQLLYGLQLDVEWYTVILVLINIASIGILLHVIIQSSHSTTSKLIHVALVLSVFTYSSILLQFTKTAAIVALAGICLIHGSKHWYVGVFLFVVGALIRFEIAYLVLLISIPLYLKDRHTIKGYWSDPKVKAMLMMVIISMGLKASDHMQYQSRGEWREYMEFNQLRGKINDNPNSYSSAIEMPVDVDHNDFRLLLNATTNPASIDTKALSSIYDPIEKTPLLIKAKNLSQLKGLAIWLILIALFLLAVLYRSKTIVRTQAILMSMIFFGLIVFICLNAILKDRVFFPALFGYSLFMFLLLRDDPFRKPFIGFTVPIILITLGLFWKSFASGLANKEERQLFQSELKMVNDHIEQGNVLISYGSGFKYELTDPFHLSSDFPHNKIFFAGWLTHIPYHKHKFESFAVLVDGHDVVVANVNLKEAAELIQGSIMRNNNIKVDARVVASTDRYGILHFQRENNAGYQ